MALLHVIDNDGKVILIHSSQIGPQRRAPASTGSWAKVWSRFDARPRRSTTMYLRCKYIAHAS